MRVSLAPVERARHAALLHAWRQQPEIARFMYAQQPIAWEAHLRWLDGLADDASRRHWVILHGGQPVGSAYLTEIDAAHARANLGMYVADEGARRFGVGAAAEWLTLETAFSSLGLEKVSCEVFALNEVPLRMHLRMGFRREGLLRRHARCEGAWTDVHRLALLREEWLEVRSALQSALGKMLADGVAPAVAPALAL